MAAFTSHDLAQMLRDGTWLINAIGAATTFEDMDALIATWEEWLDTTSAGLLADPMLKQNPQVTEYLDLIESVQSSLSRYSVNSDLWDRWLAQRVRWAQTALDILQSTVAKLATLYPDPTLPQPPRTEYETSAGKIAGFPVVFVDDPTSSDAAWKKAAQEAVESGLRMYRRRAKQTYPWLLRNALPIHVTFNCAADERGTYEPRSGYITLCVRENTAEEYSDIPKTIGHEMGHHVWYNGLSQAGRDRWTYLIRQRAILDIFSLYWIWNGFMSLNKSVDTPAHFYQHLIGVDPRLAIVFRAKAEGWRKGKREPQYQSFQTFQTWITKQNLIESGEEIPKYPITAYADLNEEEAFCEALGILVGFGPLTLLPEVQLFLSTLTHLKVTHGHR